ncbi:hypothetical protein P3S68_019982 [Capsicum galapagoense]
MERWDIVKEDIYTMVVTFFCGNELPRYITHTNVVLITKKEAVSKFNDLRPISLSSFVHKIISKVIHGRIITVLPLIILRNQTGFIKDRSITKNILLAQEIVRDINRRNRLHNVAVQLDMSKAYVRVSWIFVIKVMIRFGFSKTMINMIWRLISNNWYTMLVNGQTFGFFKSTRGLKQGDPLSPTLFRIVVEVLARGLNSLHEEDDFKGFGMPKWSKPINHLSYDDDTILFCLRHKESMKKMKKILQNYEFVSGQLINLSKSFVYLHEKVPPRDVSRIRRILQVAQGSFPFAYLGCPIFYGRNKKSHFEDLTKKISRRMLGWQNWLLSYGGRYILIFVVLQSMPIF